MGHRQSRVRRARVRGALVVTSLLASCAALALPACAGRSTAHRSVPSLHAVRAVEAAGAATGATVPVPATSGPPARRAPAVTGNPRVVLYGDSLSFEIRDVVTADAAAAGVRLDVRAFGGLALCDQLANLRTDLATLHPRAVVLEFAGNSFTPCMLNRSGQPLRGGTAAYDDKWRADLTTAADLAAAAGTRLLWASVPRSRSAEGAANVGRLQAMAHSVLDGRWGTEVTPAGDAVLDHGAFAATLPCLADEGPQRGCTGGRIPVRAPDGGHFCPLDPHAVRGVVSDCPVYSSGARRFAGAIAAAVAETLALH